MLAKKSHYALLVGGALLVLCLLFSPWSYTFQSAGISQVRKSAGYGFLLTPPEPKDESRLSGVAIDWSRLILQLAVIAISTGFVWFLLEQVEQNVGRNTVQRSERSNRIKHRLKLLIGLLIALLIVITVGWLAWPSPKTEDISGKEVYETLVNLKSWEKFDAEISAELDAEEKKRKALTHNTILWYKFKKFVDDHPEVYGVGFLNKWDLITKPFRVQMRLTRQEHTELLDFLGLAIKKEPYKSDPSFFQAIEDLKQWDLMVLRYY